MDSRDTDRIVKTAVMAAPIDRVWEAIGRAAEFGRWFGVAFDGEFVAGTRLTGRIAPTRVDPDVAKMQEPHAGTEFEVIVEVVEPPRQLAFRWHPYAVGDVNYSNEPTTLVSFELEPVAEGTKLTITESGFDAIPIERRAAAFSANDHGWTLQAALVAKYVAMQRERPL